SRPRCVRAGARSGRAHRRTAGAVQTCAVHPTSTKAGHCTGRPATAGAEPAPPHGTGVTQGSPAMSFSSPTAAPTPTPAATAKDAHAPLILVTGAARRVGAEIARNLHAAGARVALHYRSSAGEAEALAAALNALRPDSAFTVRGDLARFGAAEEIAAQVLGRGEGLDGLVNNASSFFPTPVGRIDRAAWDELMGSNLMGPLFLSQALAPALRAAGGAIVNIVDIHAERPLT